MPLIALPRDYLQIQQRLPFGVYDAFGRLLVAAGQAITDERKLAALRERNLFVDDKEAGPMRASFTNSASTLISNGATLEVIAAAAQREKLARRSRSRSGVPVAALDQDEPSAASASAAVPADRQDGAESRAPVPAQAPAPAGPKLPVFSRAGSLPQRCTIITNALGAALKDAETDPHWLARVQATLEGLRDFARFHRQATLFLLFQHAAHSNAQYAAHHATLCALVCDAVAQALGWLPEARDRIAHAALTMNVSMVALQDTLAMRDDPLRPVHKQQIASHAQRSVEMLQQAGVSDEGWLAIVRNHHEDALTKAPLADLDPTQRMTRLLITIDRFAAKVSRRGSRSPMSPLFAARDLCMSEDGRPDEYGSAILRVLGMYPPGSYVRLESGEVGVVLSPGRRMNQPQVAVFIHANGMPTTEPVLRDSAQPGRTVKEPVPVADVKVQVSPERALALI